MGQLVFLEDSIITKHFRFANLKLKRDFQRLDCFSTNGEGGSCQVGVEQPAPVSPVPHASPTLGNPLGLSNLEFPLLQDWTRTTPSWRGFCEE